MTVIPIDAQHSRNRPQVLGYTEVRFGPSRHVAPPYHAGRKRRQADV